MNGKTSRDDFSDFGSTTVSDEGPVRTENITRKRVRPKKRQGRKKRRELRA